jgi:hypothetical protein
MTFTGMCPGSGYIVSERGVHVGFGSFFCCGFLGVLMGRKAQIEQNDIMPIESFRAGWRQED